MRARVVHFHCCSLIDFQSFLSISGRMENGKWRREVENRWKMFLIKNTCVNVAVFMLVMGKFSTKTLIIEWGISFFPSFLKNMFAVSSACIKWVKYFNVINFISLKFVDSIHSNEACFTLCRKMNFFSCTNYIKKFRVLPQTFNNRCMNFTCGVDESPCTFFSTVVSSSYSWAWLDIFFY